jgi:hypothetical protein
MKIVFVVVQIVFGVVSAASVDAYNNFSLSRLSAVPVPVPVPRTPSNRDLEAAFGIRSDPRVPVRSSMQRQ